MINNVNEFNLLIKDDKNPTYDANWIRAQVKLLSEKKGGKVWESVGESLMFELGVRVPIEEIPWIGGKLDVKKFVDIFIKGLRV
jgi:hypothetical protein